MRKLAGWSVAVDNLNQEIEAILDDHWLIKHLDCEADCSHKHIENQATSALTQLFNKRLIEELAQADAHMRKIGDLYMTDNGSEVHDYLLDRIAQLKEAKS
jgi:hypothetical protein